MHKSGIQGSFDAIFKYLYIKISNQMHRVRPHSKTHFIVIPLDVNWNIHLMSSDVILQKQLLEKSGLVCKANGICMHIRDTYVTFSTTSTNTSTDTACKIVNFTTKKHSIKTNKRIRTTTMQLLRTLASLWTATWTATAPWTA